MKTGASWSNLEMVERQMIEAVGAGGKGAAAQRADNSVFRLKIQKMIIIKKKKKKTEETGQWAQIKHLQKD